METVLALGLGYTLGSIPFGLVLTRLFGAGDIRQIGSGSIGATNVLRTGRKGLAAATVLLDAGKGVLAVLLAARLWPGSEGLAAIGAIVGHCFPVWLGFRGGKGFATAAGVLGALAWPVMLVCAAVWAIAIAVSRTSSISSLCATSAAPLAAWAMGYPAVAAVMVAIAAIVFFQHRANIARLRAGTEPKIGSKG
ncbi:acyl-phosphate glycerol-3-phosphate acyltransferase [Novosphingobium kunmingense]|uniref:Glycerol-3-phosphate acyltransferase n=1 Tax=Novosphingobium kunmingense TaxID=1211806 RepID=A0A2N0I3E8_9SPHN|nr:glycerol-3-phosphate 1-O-acyltransferase PlsY [Novosphingobium kunmingense]PKB25709.1 acyl-phosphate glycerol-3-phosphate acyltransferase [Novosphingobium kunmingense]